MVTPRVEISNMLRQATLAGLTIAGLLAVNLAPVQAQVIVQPIPPVRAHRPFQVEYRQLNWKIAVFVDPAQAQAFAQTKASRGYDVAQQTLPGQTQVSYRMPQWHSYAVIPHGPEAHHLARNLQAKGYEARVIH
jgi:hypothetical protein